MTITFYNMKGCGYCRKADELFKNEISSGEMIKRPSSDAPKGVKGFPHFINDVNGKEYSGLPKDYNSLIKAIGEKSYPPNALVIFYSMNNCGHCIASKNILSEHIKRGHIVIESHTEAPINTIGFPAFQSIQSGKIVLGKPDSWLDLLQKLDITTERNVESYTHTRNNMWTIGVH
jgi:glutaredoxin